MASYGMSPRYENDLDYDDCGSSDYDEDRDMDANISDEGKKPISKPISKKFLNGVSCRGSLSHVYCVLHDHFGGKRLLIAFYNNLLFISLTS